MRTVNQNTGIQIVKRISNLRKVIRAVKGKGQSIGFVPTMGALHQGHLSLIRAAKKENDCVVVSIFVNPIQFNRADDLKAYPRTLQKDARLAKEAGADLIFAPSASEIYPANFQTSVQVGRLSQLWEGKFRPGHFRGVTTVVAKLFNLVQPNRAYFGQKDAQQARIVQQMIQDLNFDVQLRVLPTIREKDGVAMSSRNQNLSSGARRSSRKLFEALQGARRLIEWKERRGSVVIRRMRDSIKDLPGARIDYVAVVDPETLQPVKQIRSDVLILLAVWFGKVRLIDEMLIKVPHPQTRGR